MPPPKAWYDLHKLLAKQQIVVWLSHAATQSVIWHTQNACKPSTQCGIVFTCRHPQRGTTWSMYTFTTAAQITSYHTKQVTTSNNLLVKFSILWITTAIQVWTIDHSQDTSALIIMCCKGLGKCYKCWQLVYYREHVYTLGMSITTKGLTITTRTNYKYSQKKGLNYNNYTLSLTDCMYMF